jgi:formaldehyde-activating enzyme
VSDLDGRVGEGFAGQSPNTSHVNLVLARRGSPTAAALLTTLTTPAPGHTPILVCAGTGELRGPVWPPTVMINKATLRDEEHERITWGAAQLGIAQGVLDAVAEGLLEPTSETLVFVTVWVARTAVDDTAVRTANRAATLDAVRVAVHGRDPDAVRAHLDARDELRNGFYRGD